MNKTHEDKWTWKMKYCKEHGLPPAHKWAWDEAERAWNNYIRRKNKNENNK